MRAAAIQLNSTNDLDRNLASAERLVAAAAADGAELVALPEKWNFLGAPAELRAAAEPLDGRSLGAAREWSRTLGIHLLAGSISERVADDELPFNTSALIDPEGKVVATYRKIHMFDVEVGGVTYRESEGEQAGQDLVVAAVGEHLLGMTICYDLRFPELYRILAVRGARVLTVPSAFTRPTGTCHAGEGNGREGEADGLGEPKGTGVLELGRRAEARTDETGVERAVRRAAGGAESEDDGLGREQPGRAGEQGRGERDGRDGGTEAGAARVDERRSGNADAVQGKGGHGGVLLTRAGRGASGVRRPDRARSRCAAGRLRGDGSAPCSRRRC